MLFVFSPHVVFCIFLPHYGNEERADLTTEQPDELHFHGISRLLVTSSHCLFSFSVYLVKNCDNKKTTTTSGIQISSLGRYLANCKMRKRKFRAKLGWKLGNNNSS